VYLAACSAARRRLAPFLDSDLAPQIRLTPRGLGLDPKRELRLSLGNKLAKAEGLVIGASSGEEMQRDWAGVGRLVGIDLDPDREAIASKRSVIAMDAAALGFRNMSFDLVLSRSVLEHIVFFDIFLEESMRVLRPGGMFYALFGPLWPTYGGSHVGALGYKHLTLPETELLAEARAVGEGWELWLEKGLFNKLRLREYMDALGKYFEIRRVVIALSTEGLAYRKDHPAHWATLRQQWDEQDLLVRLVSVSAFRRG
jgi:SAM-dependent methyltransferase